MTRKSKNEESGSRKSPRCFIESADWSDNALLLSREESHHIIDVLRLRVGQSVTAFDGQGREADAEIVEMDRHRIVLKARHVVTHDRSSLSLVLIQALPREQKMDLVVQKATELGAAFIVPVISDHAVVHLDENGLASRHARWRQIAINAGKQCGSAWLPEIQPVRKFLHYLKNMPAMDLLLACSLEADARPLRGVIEEAKPRHPRTIGCLIGPEGDFSASERAAAREAGAKTVSLGDNVLRTETASIYVLSVLRYEFA